MLTAYTVSIAAFLSPIASAETVAEVVLPVRREEPR